MVNMLRRRVTSGAPSMRRTSTPRRGEGGEGWLRGPLWSPAVLKGGDPTTFYRSAINLARVVDMVRIVGPPGVSLASASDPTTFWSCVVCVVGFAVMAFAVSF